MSPGVPNMKTGLDALGIVENESESAKHENRTRPLGTAENESGSVNIKTGPDPLGSVENDSGHVKH
jgi:hypothetical protein